MRLIGLTGGIATGKSTVTAMLAGRGAGVVDADVLAREVLLPGTPGFSEVVSLFGTTILDSAGAVDRAALGTLVFADDGARLALERVTHPRIRALMHQRIAAQLDSDAPLVVADIPLLFERRRDHDFEATLLVYAPEATQLRRIRDRDGLEESAARQRLLAQLPIEEKRACATWVIDNSGTRAETAREVARWWPKTVSTGRR